MNMKRITTAEEAVGCNERMASPSICPLFLKTAERCLEAGKSKASALVHVPEKRKTIEMYLAVVRRNGGMLKYVPKKLKMAELCMRP